MFNTKDRWFKSRCHQNFSDFNLLFIQNFLVCIYVFSTFEQFVFFRGIVHFPGPISCQNQGKRNRRFVALCSMGEVALYAGAPLTRQPLLSTYHPFSTSMRVRVALLSLVLLTFFFFRHLLLGFFRKTLQKSS